MLQVSCSNRLRTTCTCSDTKVAQQLSAGGTGGSSPGSPAAWMLKAAQGMQPGPCIHRSNAPSAKQRKDCHKQVCMHVMRGVPAACSSQKQLCCCETSPEGTSGSVALRLQACCCSLREAAATSTQRGRLVSESFLNHEAARPSAAVAGKQ
jgi:hypothetical protein